MIDRLSFLISRGIGPVSNLATLFVVGFLFGKVAIGEYTYALAICGPIFFIITFSIPTYIAVQRPGAATRPEILWVRVGSLALSLVPAMFATFAANPKWSVSGGLWMLKAGDVLFDPVIVISATDVSSSARGRRIMRMEATRMLIVQFTLWLSAFVLHASLTTTLAVAGIANVSVAGYFLFNVPKWSSFQSSLRETWRYAGEIAKASAPMTISGVLLAIIIGSPRILLDPVLVQDERTIVGLAQIAGSVFALLFNAGWMYELGQLKSTAELGDFHLLFRKNLKLSLVFLTVLSGGSLLILVMPGTLLHRVGITDHYVGLLAFVVFALGLPHCFSVHRDVLKLVERAWLETRILLTALATGSLVWYLCASVFHWRWTSVLVLMVFAMTLVQGSLATWALFRATGQDLRDEAKEEDGEAR